jgi:primosomal replication protein N
MEAGLPRKVEFEIHLVGIAETARWLASVELGMPIHVEGFLAAKSRKSRQLVLHVNTLRFVEGNENAETVREEKAG